MPRLATALSCLGAAVALIILFGGGPAAAQDWDVPHCDATAGFRSNEVTVTKIVTDLRWAGGDGGSMYIAVCDGGANECSTPLPGPDQGNAPFGRR